MHTTDKQGSGSDSGGHRAGEHRAGEGEHGRDRTIPLAPKKRKQDGAPTGSEPDSQGRGAERPDEGSHRSAPRLPERSGLNRGNTGTEWEEGR